MYSTIVLDNFLTYKPIPVPVAKGFIFLQPMEIRFIEAIHNGCRIHSLRQEEPFVAPYTLWRILKRLPVKKFCRVHKGFIVCIPHMSGSNKTKTRIYFLNTLHVPVSETYRKRFLEMAGFEVKQPTQPPTRPTQPPNKPL